jgi:hypothetical protein
MFLGHWGVGFGAKSVAPRVSLGTAFLAAQWVDLLWPTLLVAGLETVRVEPGATRVTPLDFVHYPYTHSLVAGIFWAALLGGIHYLGRRSLRAASVIGFAVVSHWFLDLVVHAPDLPLVPGGGPHVGLGLWESLTATAAVEVAVLVAGLALYLRATEPRDRAGSLGLGALAAFLLVVYAANVLGPPPPNAESIAWIGHAQWLLVAAGYGVDRHRRPRETPA